MASSLFNACLVVIVPLAYLIINSIKLPREFLTIPPTILPTEVTFEHYQELIDDKKTVRYFQNSLTVAVWTTGITILTGTLAAYGLARMRLAATVLALVTFIFLFIRFYPRVTTVIPFFLVMRQFDMLDTVWAIIIGQLGITIPFVTWLMLVVFQDLPSEIEEAAIVDGASVLAALLACGLTYRHAECLGGGHFDGLLVLERILDRVQRGAAQGQCAVHRRGRLRQRQGHSVGDRWRP